MERSTKKTEKVSTYIGDDDTTTLSYLPENVTYDVDKWSDIDHAKRSLKQGFTISHLQSVT